MWIQLKHLPFLLPRGWKAVFEALSPFPRDWKTVFRVSSTDDERFLAISAFRQPTTSVFLHFLALRGVGNTFFSIFHSSEPSESHFFQFSTHPSPRKAIFCSFPLIRGLGQSFLSVFASSAYRNLNRLLNPASCFTNDLYTLWSVP